MFSLKTVILLIATFLISADALRNFHNGKLFKKDVLRLQKSTRLGALGYFNQIVDHFDPTNTATWQQKYLASEGTNNSIAFLMIEGEGPMGNSFFNGMWSELATELGAYIFQLEHRYYGESQPFENLTTESLRFLSSDQALADAATFISAMNREYDLSEDVLWVSFGGSYAGSLSAWLRYKYPHLVHAAVSSSGPLNAVLDFEEYLEVVVGALNSSNPQCSVAVSNAFTQIQETVANNASELTDLFYLCEDFTQELASDTLESSSFYGTLTDSLALIVQYNGLLYVNVDDICNIMLDENGGTELSRYSSVVQLLLPYLADGDCIDFRYTSFIDELRDYSLEGAAGSGGSRQWIYQTCTEFGFYQTSDSTQNIFGDTVSLDFFTQICSDVYDNDFDVSFQERAIKNTNILKGGTNLEVSNVVFVHGGADPWHVLGVLESSERAGPAIVIDGASHCNDMYSSSSAVTNENLVAARNEIRRLVRGWLA